MGDAAFLLPGESVPGALAKAWNEGYDCARRTMANEREIDRLSLSRCACGHACHGGGNCSARDDDGVGCDCTEGYAGDGQ